jgi:DNA polymerase-3 subunit beta
VEEESEAISLTFPANDLKIMLERTSFAMAQQDVRYFFNGMLFDLGNNQLKLVATNGQRMAICLYGKPISGEGKFIVPRKGVLEMLRLIRDQAGDTNCDVNLRFSHHHIGIDCGKASLISKLIDGEFPNYEDAIPNSGDKILEGDRQEIKDALVRTAILSNEMYRNVKLNLTKGQLGIEANNPLQEDAEEEVQVAYEGPDLAIGFNVSYLIDTLSAMNGEKVRLTLTDGSSAVLLTDPGEKSAIYVISPMVI